MFEDTGNANPTSGTGLTGIEIRLLGPGDNAVLENVRRDTFDHSIIPAPTQAFLDSALHKIVVALNQGQVFA